jgi:hypothetical protein
MGGLLSSESSSAFQAVGSFAHPGDGIPLSREGSAAYQRRFFCSFLFAQKAAQKRLACGGLVSCFS